MYDDIMHLNMMGRTQTLVLYLCTIMKI